ncbi:MAG: GyrI-like domain-containing protein [Lachnospiraceae bacterium]|nr:GyrI-like domain-containing protein [Lachnospiraceae bacterium]
MAFDFKKEYKEFYLPSTKPDIVMLPPMNYIAVRGKGDPNEEDGEYKAGIELLYAVAYTVKMSYRKGYKIDGYFEYVMPPLEGLWRQEGIDGMDYAHKEKLHFISLIRLPDFVTKKDFEWAVNAVAKKKQMDFSKAEFFHYEEGLCVQCMHIGSYDDEPQTIAVMHEYAKQNGYEPELTDGRFHHEIYLSDPRKCEVSKRKTVVRHPVRKCGTT